MYSQLNAEMVRANQSEIARRVALAERRQEAKGDRSPVRRSGEKRRRVGIATAISTLFGRTGEALAATSADAPTAGTF